MCPINAVPVPWEVRDRAAAGEGIKGRDVLADYWNANGTFVGADQHVLQAVDPAFHDRLTQVLSAREFRLDVRSESGAVFTTIGRPEHVGDQYQYLCTDKRGILCFDGRWYATPATALAWPPP